MVIVAQVGIDGSAKGCGEWLTLMLRSKLPVTRCTSSNCKHVTGPVCPTKLLCTCPLLKSQSLTIPSAVPHASAASKHCKAPTKSADASGVRPVARHLASVVFMVEDA